MRLHAPFGQAGQASFQQAEIRRVEGILDNCEAKCA